MKDTYSKLNYLLQTIEGIDEMNPGQRQMMLVLLYWKVFDKIDIPDKTMRQIVAKGTKPETITRSYRRSRAESNKVKGE